MPEPVKYFGKYRGSVFAVDDPLNMGRIQAQVPDVLGSTPSGWAMPAVPLAGPQVSTYVIPPVGAGIWVEFEHGDKSFPIWTGCWWGSKAEVPPSASAGSPSIPPNMVLQPQAGPQGAPTAILTGDSGHGELNITLKTPGGASLVINDNEIVISNGKGASISLKGNTVNINDGALTVT
jgi:uncharacterized protein involved in type VI secretion and phage assembly